MVCGEGKQIIYTGGSQAESPARVKGRHLVSSSPEILAMGEEAAEIPGHRALSPGVGLCYKPL